MTDLLTRPDHDTFYEVYPRKVGKKCSQKAHKSAIKGVSPEALQRAVEAFAAITDEQTKYKSLTGKAKQEALKYTVHPATWLNQGRWEDEVIEEYLARPAEPEMITIKATDPGYDAWVEHMRMNHENPNAYRLYIKGGRFHGQMRQLTPFPSQGDE